MFEKNSSQIIFRWLCDFSGLFPQGEKKLCEKILWVHMCNFLGGESMAFWQISEWIHSLNRSKTAEIRGH